MNKHMGKILAIVLAAVVWGASWVRADTREVIGSSPGVYLATSTDALTTAVSGGGASYHYGITFATITTGSVVNLMLTDNVGTRTLKLNGGTATTAGVLYWQEFDLPGSWTMNLQVATATTPVFTIVKMKNDR